MEGMLRRVTKNCYLRRAKGAIRRGGTNGDDMGTLVISLSVAQPRGSTKGLSGTLSGTPAEKIPSRVTAPPEERD